MPLETSPPRSRQPPPEPSTSPRPSGGGTASTTFEVTPDILRVVSSPASNSYSGSPATSPFAIQVLLGDGATPVIGTGVNVTSSNATLGACALTTCTLITDGQGMISTLVTAIAPGMVSLTASAAGVTVSTSFTAAAPPDALQVLSTPTNGSYVGRSSTIPFIVQVTAGNATNHVFSAFASPQTALPILSGVAVTLSATGATLDACGLASCTLTTGALGTVSTTVTPTTAGSVTLAASAAGGTTSSSFAAATPAKRPACSLRAGKRKPTSVESPPHTLCRSACFKTTAQRPPPASPSP